MKPFYFGTARRLFGVYHEPAPALDRGVGVVLCYPLGHEYAKTHWAFRRLATSLASAGYSALRFDYFGCGDSEGAVEDWDLEGWRHDIHQAADELRRQTGSSDVSLVGLRLGAFLAAAASAERTDVRNLVLWNPVLAGREFLDDLACLHAEARRWRRWQRQAPDASALLGYDLPASLRTALERVDFLVLARRVRAQRILLTLSDAEPRYEALQEALRSGGTWVSARIIPETGNWEELHSRGPGRLTTRMPHAIAEVLAEEDT